MTELENLDEIWQIAEEAFSEKQKIENNNEGGKNFSNCCHKYDHFNTCINCGHQNFISSGAEWNNYKDQSTGEYSKNTQRADLYVDDNPFAASVGGSIIPFSNKSLIGRLQIQQTFNHKQKTYWLISEQIETCATLLNLKKTVIDDAKHNWASYMKSGKLTRASVRQGLIAACLFRSCITNNVPIERDEIIRAFSCDTKTLSKGEKVLYEILNTNSNMPITGIEIENSNSFIRYCNQLGLEFKIANTCNDLFIKHKVPLQAVTPKSAIGGILAYTVKHILKQKNPSKTVISATVDICTPTLNKVISLIEKLENN